MFRLANYGDNETDALYKYLTCTASKVIWNALDIWAGSVPAILDIYLTEFAGPPIGVSDVDFFEGISQYISPDIVRPEIKATADRVKIGKAGISADGRIGMELLARKIARMKDKMADPVHFYTFDLFEEFLFAKMLESYEPEIFEGISQYISPDIVRPEIKATANRVKIGRSQISVDGRVGMELLARKTARMKDKMADPVHFYTFDLFEEFLFAKMLASYDPDIFEGEEDPYVITTDEEVAEAARKLLTEYKVGEDLEVELGEPGLGKEYANWLARTIHRVDQMDLWASEEAGFDSLYFWDADYELVFDGTFREGIKGLTGGTAAIMGYGYENVKEIFTDIGLKAPLLLIGTEAAFNAVEEVTQEKIVKAMREMEARKPEKFMKRPDEENNLPFK